MWYKHFLQASFFV